MESEQLWNKITETLSLNADELQTKTGLWFKAYRENNKLYVDRSEKTPSCSINMRRPITKDNFMLVHPYYERWVNGEAGIRQEVKKISDNPYYIFALIEKCSQKELFIYKSISEETFKKDFFNEIIDVECGRHFDINNEQHKRWLCNKIHSIFLLGGNVLAAYKEAEPVGFIFYQHDRGLENECCFGKKADIIMFEIREKYRSQNIGKILLNKISASVKANGGACLYTDTYVPNKRAIKFYIENDFIPVAVFPCVNGIDDDGQLYMYKVL